MKSFNDYLNAKRAQYGDKFSAVNLDQPALIDAWRTGTRIKVRDCGEIMTGTVGITTGWVPSFLLMRSANARGSAYTLDPGRWELLAVKRGNKYVPVEKI